MAGTTAAPWSIPYPTGTDRVADGDNAMQAIADRLNVLMNSYWIETDVVPTPDPQVNIGGTRVFRRGRMATLIVEAGPNVTWNTSWVIMFVPTGWRPVKRVIFPVNAASSNYTWQLDTDGSVRLVAPTSMPAALGYGTVAYPIA